MIYRKTTLIAKLYAFISGCNFAYTEQNSLYVEAAFEICTVIVGGIARRQKRKHRKQLTEVGERRDNEDCRICFTFPRKLKVHLNKHTSFKYCEDFSRIQLLWKIGLERAGEKVKPTADNEIMMRGKFLFGWFCLIYGAINLFISVRNGIEWKRTRGKMKSWKLGKQQKLSLWNALSVISIWQIRTDENKAEEYN